MRQVVSTSRCNRIQHMLCTGYVVLRLPASRGTAIDNGAPSKKTESSGCREGCALSGRARSPQLQPRIVGAVHRAFERTPVFRRARRASERTPVFRRARRGRPKGRPSFDGLVGRRPKGRPSFDGLVGRRPKGRPSFDGLWTASAAIRDHGCHCASIQRRFDLWRPVAAVFLVARHPVAGENGAGKRDLAGKRDRRCDLGELVGLAGAATAEHRQAFALGR